MFTGFFFFPSFPLPFLAKTKASVDFFLLGIIHTKFHTDLFPMCIVCLLFLCLFTSELCVKLDGIKSMLFAYFSPTKSFKSHIIPSVFAQKTHPQVSFLRIISAFNRRSCEIQHKINQLIICLRVPLAKP